MKRLIIISLASLTLVCFGGGNALAQNQELSKKEAKELKKEQKKAAKERQKKIDNYKDAASFAITAKYVKDGNFVLEADQIRTQKGGIASVSSNTNFLWVSNGEAVVQIAPSNFISGPNGVGGITVEGKISNVEISEGKSGNLSYSYNVQGIGISATVKVMLTKGGTNASATVYPNFNSTEITLTGRITSPQKSKVFKGRSL